MPHEAGLLSEFDLAAMSAGLDQLAAEVDSVAFAPAEADEQMHRGPALERGAAVDGSVAGRQLADSSTGASPRATRRMALSVAPTAAM